jgi:cyclopropane-fatty-acyl-phospholipid synthase
MDMMINKQLKNSALKALESVEYGSLDLTFPDGQHYAFAGKGQGAKAALVMHDWRALRALLFNGDIGFAEAYRNGWCDSPDLAALVQFSLENEPAMEDYLHGSFLGKIVSCVNYMLNSNTLRGSRRNIHAHYDLGNEFYKLWLDPTMTYSAAIFSSPEEGLVAAQQRKYDRIIDRLGQQSGNVLEIGCGWGGFANRAIEKGDFAIKGVTLSHEQKEYAETVLGGQAEIALEDYRHQQGK